jgi:hypothetical protein
MIIFVEHDISLLEMIISFTNLPFSFRAKQYFSLDFLFLFDLYLRYSNNFIIVLSNNVHQVK